MPACLPISPVVRPAFLEITLLGLRSLLPVGFMKIQKPQVLSVADSLLTCLLACLLACFTSCSVALQVLVFAKTICDCSGDCPRCQPYVTEPSRNPSGTNPNYLLRIMLVRVMQFWFVHMQF